MSYQDSWGDILSKHVQPRCKICADGTGLEADIAFAMRGRRMDAGYPVFKERDGVSLILARSERGAEVLERAVQSGDLCAGDADIEDIEAMQPGQVRRRRALLGRLLGRVITGHPFHGTADLAFGPAPAVVPVGNLAGCAGHGAEVHHPASAIVTVR